MSRESYIAHKQGDEKITMETPDGIRVEVMRKKVPVKLKWGWKVVKQEKKGKE